MELTGKRETGGPSGHHLRSSEAWRDSGRRPRPGKWPWWCPPMRRSGGADAVDRWPHSETTTLASRSIIWTNISIKLHYYFSPLFFCLVFSLSLSLKLFLFIFSSIFIQFYSAFCARILPKIQRNMDSNHVNTSNNIKKDKPRVIIMIIMMARPRPPERYLENGKSKAGGYLKQNKKRRRRRRRRRGGNASKLRGRLTR